VIHVETSSATILMTEAPEPKVKDRQTDEIAKGAVSGEALMKVGVVFVDEGESSLIAVTVPESGAATAGASTRELMTRMGRSSSRAALIYQRMTSDRDRIIADRLGAMIRGGGGAIPDSRGERPERP
jgi:hypothetical protein